MRHDFPLEQEYRNLKRREAPDLWSRIEESLEERQERGLVPKQEERVDRKIRRPYRNPALFTGRVVLSAAASIAAVYLLMTVGPRYRDLFPVRQRGETGAEDRDTFSGEAGRAAETTAFVAETDPEREEADGETAWGVLYYDQLKLADYQSLSLPAKAVTVPEDAMYFSEEILEDTELLCQGTVTGVSLETDDLDRPVCLAYEVRVDSVCYSDDYITGVTHIQVKSPIVRAVGGDQQILYQLQAGASYVLPLKRQEDDWELIYPFAPQIRVTPGGGYLFHSGYASLTDEGTFVVVGQQEGVNDFYYDRMLLRDDDTFLSDLISLVKSQTLNGGRL